MRRSAAGRDLRGEGGALREHRGEAPKVLVSEEFRTMCVHVASCVHIPKVVDSSVWEWRVLRPK